MSQLADILSLLRGGAATSREIAERLGAERKRIAVALCYLADRGAIVRAGVANARRIGRPCVRWRLSHLRADVPAHNPVSRLTGR